MMGHQTRSAGLPAHYGRYPAQYAVRPMATENTTIVVQRYLDAIGGDAATETQVRALLDQSVRRLHMLCANLLHRSYPRLARPPLNLRPEEMLSAVVERLIKALRAVRPGNVRQFFGLANQHMRWELNDLARRLDEQPRNELVAEGLIPAPPTSESGLSQNSCRMLQAIDELPPEEREAFELVRLQGLSHCEAAEVIGVSTKTVQRRIHRGMLTLAEILHDLRPDPIDPA
jgi:RNA polymerase sigma factor (sigma-70 family)